MPLDKGQAREHLHNFQPVKMATGTFGLPLSWQ